MQSEYLRTGYVKEENSTSGYLAEVPGSEISDDQSLYVIEIMSSIGIF